MASCLTFFLSQNRIKALKEKEAKKKDSIFKLQAVLCHTVFLDDKT